MNASPNSALIVFPIEQDEDITSYRDFVVWWAQYQNMILSVDDRFSDLSSKFPNQFWKIEPATENLFFASNTLSLINFTKSKRVYFIGSDICGTLETNIRIASLIGLDPVFVLNNKESFKKDCQQDFHRLSKYCEIADLYDFNRKFQ